MVIAEYENETNFVYSSGSIENTEIREEIIQVLERGKKAIMRRNDKLGLFK